MLQSYGDPDAFRAHLNAAVEALRNVTFILQSEKASVPGFDQWYGQWQAKARADIVLQWLHDARTEIVHRGDLETESRARVTVKLSWTDPTITEFEASPFLSPGEIAAAELPKLDLPDDIERDGILAVERRWVDKALPQWELLDALAYCYGEVAQVVADAHTRAGSRMVHVETEPDHARYINAEHLRGRLPCMVATAEARTAVLHLGTGELMELEKITHQIDVEEGRQAAERYGLPKIDPAERGDPFALADAFLPHARRMLLMDGHHVPLLFLLLPEGGLEYYGIPTEDRANRFLLWQSIAGDVERSGATGLVTIGEVWMGTQYGVDRALAPTDDPFRREALMVTAASTDGRVRVTLIPFFRRLGRVFTKPTQTAFQDAPPNFLLPVVDAWGRLSEPPHAAEPLAIDRDAAP